MNPQSDGDHPADKNIGLPLMAKPIVLHIVQKLAMVFSLPRLVCIKWCNVL